MKTRFIKHKITGRWFPVKIDDEDIDIFNKYNWFLYRNRDTEVFYVRTSKVTNGKKKAIHLHREILGVSDPSVKVDHKSGIATDNRKDNLRLVSIRENNLNASKKRHFKNKPTSSKYKGVSFHKASGKWSARIRDGKKEKHLGLFLTEENAAQAYNEAAAIYYGEYARSN